jgi:hypothetical protein
VLRDFMPRSFGGTKDGVPAQKNVGRRPGRLVQGLCVGVKAIGTEYIVSGPNITCYGGG